jgi:hypothetical protein
MRSSACWVVSLFLIALACMASDRPELDWVDYAAIDAGEVSLKLEKLGRVTLVDVAIRIDAPVEAIWAVLRACDVAPEYVPNVVACQSIETLDDGRSEFFIQTVKPAFFIPAFEHVFRLDYDPYRRIDLSRVSGPIRQFEGYWWLEQEARGSVLLVYRVVVDPGMPIPRLFVRQTLRRDLPVVLMAVRDRAEAAAAR